MFPPNKSVESELNTHRVLALIGRVHEHANELIEHELSRHRIRGLVTSHGDILAALTYSGRLTMSELARAIHRKKNTVTVLVAKLAKYGYVAFESGDKDRRQKIVVLTKKGLSLKGPVSIISRQILAKAYQDFSDAEKRTLAELITRMLGNFQRE